MFNPFSYFFHWFASQLASRGLIDGRRGDRIASLTWPRFLTMFARNSQRVADVAMVGLSIGSAGVAGLAFANIYWQLGQGIAIGLAGGTISQVSLRYGADLHDSIDLTVKQSMWIGFALMLPFTIVYAISAEPLVSVFTSDLPTIRHGAQYLGIISISLIFTALNLVSSRTLAGADDTWIAMAIRATGAFTNIALNAIFIFGLEMGVTGAAIGTVMSEILVTAFFGWGFIHGSLPIIGKFPVHISLTRPFFDLTIVKQLLTITPPLMMVSIGRSVANFPLFALIAIFGPTVVAAFEVGLRVRSLLGAFGAGFSMSASSLIGQELGRGNEEGADLYHRDVIRVSTVIYVGAAAAVLLFAPQIAPFFADEPDMVATTVPFIQIAAISFVGFGLSFTFEGVLKAAGDNRWSMYGRLFGKYIVLLPIVYLGTLTSLGVVAVYIAMTAETWTAAAITRYRVASGRWMEVSRSYRPESITDTD